MATTIKLKNGSGAPLAGDLVQGEPALDLTNKRLYTENASGTVIEVGTNPSTLTVDTTTLVVDAGNNRVGVGTASPARNLSVVDASAPHIQLATSADQAASNGFELAFDGSANYIAGRENVPTLFYTNNIERMRIDSTGDVLIGTNATSYLNAANRQVCHVNGGTDGAILALTGTASGSYPGSTGDFYIASGASGSKNTSLVTRSNGYMNFYTNNTERMRIDSSGNLLVGTTAGMTQGGGGPLQVYSTSGSQLILGKGTGAPSISFGSTTTQYGLIEGINGGGFTFYTGNGTVSSRLVIDSSGNLGLNTAGPSTYGGGFVVDDLGINIVAASNSGTGTNKLSWWSDNNGVSQNAYISVVNDGATTNTGEMVFYTKNASATLAERMRISASGNLLVNTLTQVNSAKVNFIASSTTNVLGLKNANDANYLITAFNSSASEVFRVAGTGNVLNTNNSYGAISDERLKSNIVDASSQIDDIMAVQVRSYTLDSTGNTHIGVVAQELEASGMSGLVEEDEEGIKSVKYSVLYMKAIKALQEAVTRIETLEAEVAALKGA